MHSLIVRVLIVRVKVDAVGWDTTGDGVVDTIKQLQDLTDEKKDVRLKTMVETVSIINNY